MHQDYSFRKNVHWPTQEERDGEGKQVSICRPYSLPKSDPEIVRDVKEHNGFLCVKARPSSIFNARVSKATYVIVLAVAVWEGVEEVLNDERVKATQPACRARDHSGW
jgi:hypothetical protein